MGIFIKYLSTLYFLHVGIDCLVAFVCATSVCIVRVYRAGAVCVLSGCIVLVLCVYAW